jgi:PAS domain S-box-containing protein
MEMAIKHSKEKYRRLFESSRDAIMTLEPPSWAFTSGNPATLAMFGAKCVKEFISLSPGDLSPERQPDGRLSSEKAGDMIETAMREGYHSFEWIHRRMDGKEFPAAVLLIRVEISGKRYIQATVRDISERKLAEKEEAKTLLRQKMISQLLQSLLAQAPLEVKLSKITDSIVNILEADFCRIWLTWPGDLCEQGCIHATVLEGPHVCRYRDRCLHLSASSGRYTHLDGAMHRRVPFGCYKIGLIASGNEHRFLSNDVQNDPGVHNHEWAQELGLVSFAGYQLRVPGGETMGVMALFAKHPISPIEDALLDSISSAVGYVIRQTLAEDALRDSETRFRTMFDHSNVGKLFAAPNGNLMKTNRAFAEMLGYRIEEIQDVNFLELTHPDDSATSREIVRSLLSGEQTSHRIDKRYIHKNGGIIWADTNIVLYRDGGGIPQYFIVSVVNITDRKHAEEAKRESDERYAMVLSAVNDGFWDWAVPTGDAFFSPIYYALLGYDDGEFPATYATWRTLVHPDDIDRAERELLQSIETGSGFAIDLRMKMKSGEWRWVSTRGRTVEWDDEKRARRMVGTLTDITSRKQADEALRESEERYRIITENMTEGIVYLDMGMNIKFVTPSAVERGGYTHEEMMSTPLKQRLTEESYARLMKAASENLVPEKLSDPGWNISLEIELEYIRKDGSRYWSGSIFKVIRDVEGRPVGILGVGRDITERKRVEERIQMLLAEKELLLKEVHHRIKNNMTLIANLLSLQASRLADPEGVKALKESHSRVMSMAKMYNLLYKTIDFRYVHTKEYIGLLIDGLTASLPAIEGVTLEKRIDDFEMDSEILFPIGIIINELVTNAYKYAFQEGRTGTIAVSISRLPENRFEVIVRDDGAGIPESFDCNGQTGFGMKLVNLLVKQIEGTLECVRGVGTTFRVTFQYDDSPPVPREGGGYDMKNLSPPPGDSGLQQGWTP